MGFIIALLGDVGRFSARNGSIGSIGSIGRIDRMSTGSDGIRGLCDGVGSIRRVRAGCWCNCECCCSSAGDCNCGVWSGVSCVVRSAMCLAAEIR